MELVAAGAGWAVGIMIMGHFGRGKIQEREIYASVMVLAFAFVNGVLL